MDKSGNKKLSTSARSEPIIMNHVCRQKTCGTSEKKAAKSSQHAKTLKDRSRCILRKRGQLTPFMKIYSWRHNDVILSTCEETRRPLLTYVSTVFSYEKPDPVGPAKRHGSAFSAIHMKLPASTWKHQGENIRSVGSVQRRGKKSGADEGGQD